ALPISIEKLAPNFGIKVLYKERFDPSLRDFKTILSKARVFKPDVFYVVSFPPSLDIIGQELQTLGIRNISSSAAFGISAKPELFEGLWYNDGNFVDVTFRSRFEKAFPGVRFNVRSAPYGYDIFRMFVKAFESGEDVTAYLSNLTEYDGMAGKITKTAGSRNFHSQPGLWIIKNGKAEPLAN
ncbi:ABC transporter substrate-binding protein, partial [Patescibacteria group bacterium]